jgi:hypothetical protein
MKKILTILCIAGLFAFTVSETQAQDTRFGIKGGLSFYKVAGDFSIDFMGSSLSESFDTGTKMGFHGGIFMEKPLNQFLSIQPEVNFIQKGSRESDDFGDDIDSFFGAFEDDGVTMSYIDVPLLLKVNIPLGENLTPFLSAGGYLGYLLGAEVEFEGSTEDISNDVKDISYGLLFGAGVNFGFIFVEARYDHGMSNLFENDLFTSGEFNNNFNGDFGIDVNIRNRGISLAVGFIF